MVHISKRPLSNKELNALYSQFNDTLGGLDNKQSGLFLSELLGKEEKIMLAKRLAVIVMLYREQSLYKIAGALKISSSTAQKIQSQFYSGRYNNLLSVIKKDKVSFTDLLDAIDSILHLGGIMPHYGQTHHSEAYKRNKKRT